MDRRRKLIMGAVVSVAALGFGTAAMAGGDDTEAPIIGSALESAGAAALEHTGAGKVTDTERPRQPGR